MRKTTILILTLILSFPLFAQLTTIHVVDEASEEPCAYANIVFKDARGTILKGGITNNEGIFSYELKKEAQVTISYIGYLSQTFDIQAASSITVKLKPDAFEMEQVVITGQHKAQPVDKSIYKVDIISARSLQERGVTNLADALAYETSIKLKVDPSTGTSIRMQGMGGENIKYLIDGVPVIGRVRGDIDLSQINMENVDHIEIVQGPMSVQYGTSAIAGVINIITKKNSNYKNLIKANSYTDQKGTYNFGAYGSAIRGKHSLTLAGNRNLFQGQDLTPELRYMDFKPKMVYNTDASYVYRRKDFHFELKTQYMYSLVKDYADQNTYTAMAYDNDYHTNRSTNSLVISDKLSENISFNITGAYTWFGRKTDNISSDLFLLSKDITSYTTTTFNNYMTRGSLSIAPPDENWSMMTGWDINLDDGHGDKMAEDASIGDYAAYLSGQYSPLSSLSLQPGIRFIYNTIYGSPLIPSFNLQWGFAEGFNYRASYAKGFRSPSLKELYLDFKDSNHNISGNTDLKAETTNSYNTSLAYSAKKNDWRVSSDLSFFYNNGKDAIVLLVTDASNNEAINVNLGGRRTLGGEIHGSLYHISGLKLSLGISRIGETFDELGDGEYLPIAYYNNYSINLRHTFQKIGLIANGSLKYYGKTPSITAIPEEDGGGLFRATTDSYGDLEFSLSKNFWKHKINLVAGGKNLLNVTYIQLTDYDALTNQAKYFGRVWFLQMNLKLSK